MNRPPWDERPGGNSLLDGRTVIAMLLSIGIYWGWMAMFPPAVSSPPEAPVPQPAVITAPGSDDAVVGAPPAEAEALAPAARKVAVHLCDASAILDTSDGSIGGVRMDDATGPYHVTALYQWALTGFSGAWHPYGESPSAAEILTEEANALVVGSGPVDGAAPWVEVDGLVGDSLPADRPVITRSRTADGLSIERVIRVVEGVAEGEPCRLAVDVTWSNAGSQTWSGDVWLAMQDVLPVAASQYDAVRESVAGVDGGLYVHPGDPADVEELVGPVDFFGLADRYFGALLAVGTADRPGAGHAVFTESRRGGGVQRGTHYVLPAQLAPGAQLRESFTLYIGTKELARLKAVDPRLGVSVDFGFFAVFALVLLYVLRALHGVFGDWAASIVGLTFLVKTAFFRLTQKSFESTKQMQALQPQIDLLKKELKDNPEEQNRRIMELFRETGVNPAGGCLPMLVQMPVWLALYSVLLTSAELYHAQFMWLKDLTAIDPYMVLPTVVVALMLVQQRMTPMGNLDPAQAQLMRWMPLIFGVFFYSLPSGLVLYIFVNMLLSMAQQWYINKTFKGVPPAKAAAPA